MSAKFPRGWGAGSFLAGSLYLSSVLLFSVIDMYIRISKIVVMFRVIIKKCYIFIA